MGQIKKIFEPGRIGQMEVKNRIVMAPMGTGRHGPEGELTERLAEYYAARARGGVGLIICQSSIILWESRAPFRPSIYDDKFIPSFKQVADAIHEGGGKAAFQLVHHGRLLTDYQAQVSHPEDIKPIAPSALSRLLIKEAPSQDKQEYSFWVRGNIIPMEASKEDIRRVTQGFAEAALRVKKAGFDAVEIHGGHGYLLSQFLSPLVNRRMDEYGGSPVNRARFTCEVLAATRQKVGPDFPIILRISGSDFLPGGICVEEVVQQVPLFEEAGADALDISASEQGSIDWQYPSFLFSQGALVPLAAAVKKVAKIPVIAVGKIYHPDFAENIIKNGKADFVALGRTLLADPEWPNKAKEGRYEDIRHCIYCLNCLNFTEYLSYVITEGVSCSVNPRVQHEKISVPVPTSSPKKIMVVGAGPAGMEAARTLAERGHHVELYEQKEVLGGQWYVASRQTQKKEDYSRLLHYLKRGLEKAGVPIKMNTRVTADLVKNARPNAVVVATGAVPSTLDIPGITGKNVVQANDVILGKKKVRHNVVVAGGRYLGLEIADQLVSEGKKVSLVTRRELGRAIERNVYLTLRNRLVEKGVYLYTHSPVVEIKDNGLYIVFNNDLFFLPADTIVLAVGVKPEKELAEQIKDLVPEVYSIGDCVAPRDVMYAIREADELARKI
jgi:2,4-dienoyl-CoA reductase-like NADH-dependent reductase (Old Yellow Enzyme family)/thioredoxin reductase